MTDWTPPPDDRPYLPTDADLLALSAAGPRIMKVTREGNALRGTCPYCGKTHTHGAAGDTGPNFGHRVAHCAAPNKNAGYHLVLAE